jgi:DNA-binding MarR family transcriptional regulator
VAGQARGPAKNALVDVWLLSGLSRALVDDLLRGTGMTPDEFAVYGLVVDLAPVTAADLARATGMSATTLSSLVARCEARGDLERAENPGDRRHRPLRLTEQGMIRYRGPLPAFADLLARLEAATDLPTPDVRFRLQALDAALRAVSGAQPRPYSLAPPDGETLSYAGPPLTAKQRREVLAYVDWVRHRDTAERPG